MPEIEGVGLRVQVAFDVETAKAIRALAEEEHRPVRFQVEQLVLEALKARKERR